MSETTTSEQLKAGTLIDERYEIIDLLGTGGFANVYRARHVHLNRDVALKVLHPPLTAAAGPGETFAKRFEQEAQIAAAFDHPNIVGIFDYGFLPGDEPYIAMSYLDGHDLEEELVRTPRIEPQRAIRLMQGCLEGVAHGHVRGVVHKDLKPSNLYLVAPGTREERLVVLDFGIARVFNDPDAKLTKSGLFSGTPAYLAPEYVREQMVTPALDVYQLGLILIEMLTGRPAVHADGPMGYLLAHCMGRLSVSPGFFEGALGQVLKKAVEVSPDNRYRDAAEFSDALSELDLGTIAVGEAGQVPSSSSISQAEVEQFANTLPASLLVDTKEWSDQVGKPQTTPGAAGGTLEGFAPRPGSSPSDGSASGLPKVAEVAQVDESQISSPQNPPAERTPDVAEEKNKKLWVALFGVIALIAIAGGAIALIAMNTPSGDANDELAAASPDAALEAPAIVESARPGTEADAGTDDARAATLVAQESAESAIGLAVRAAANDAAKTGRDEKRSRRRPSPAPKPPRKKTQTPKPDPDKPRTGPLLIGN